MDCRIHRGVGWAGLWMRRCIGCDNGPMAESGQVNEAVAGQPAEPLRPFIAYYSGCRQAGIEPAEHRGLPSPYLTRKKVRDATIIRDPRENLPRSPRKYSATPKALLRPHGSPPPRWLPAART